MWILPVFNLPMDVRRTLRSLSVWRHNWTTTTYTTPQYHPAFNNIWFSMMNDLGQYDNCSFLCSVTCYNPVVIQYSTWLCLHTSSCDISLRGQDVITGLEVISSSKLCCKTDHILYKYTVLRSYVYWHSFEDSAASIFTHWNINNFLLRWLNSQEYTAYWYFKIHRCIFMLTLTTWC